MLSRQRLEREDLTRAVFVATCEANLIDDVILRMHDVGLEMVTLHDRPEGGMLGRYHYVIEVENEAGVAEAQIEAVCEMAEVRFAGCFTAMEK